MFIEEKIIPAGKVRSNSSVTGEDLLEVEKQFIKDQKKQKLNYIAEVSTKDSDKVIIKRITNSKYLRNTLLRVNEGKGFIANIPYYDADKDLRKDSVAGEIVDLFDDGFNEDDFFGSDLDSSIDLDDDTLEPDNEDFQKAWDYTTQKDSQAEQLSLLDDNKEQQVQQTQNEKKTLKPKYQTILDSIQEERDINEEDDIDDIYDDALVIDDNEVIYIKPKPEALNYFYYHEGYVIEYDSLHRSPEKGKKQNITYGNRDVQDYYSILLNKVLNFDMDKAKLVSTLVIPYIDDDLNINTQVQQRIYKKEINNGIETLKIYMATDGKNLRYIYSDGNLDIDLKMLIKREKNFNKLYKVPYTIETYETKQKLLKEKFAVKNFSKTYILPNVTRFNEFLNLGYMKNANYEVYDTVNKVIDFVDLMYTPKYRDVVKSIDLESTGLDLYYDMDRPDQVVSYQFSWEDHQAIIIPTRMRYCQNVDPREVREILRNFLVEHKFLAHNGGDAECRFLASEGLKLNLTEDTMILIKHLLPFITKGKVYLNFGRAIDDLVYQAFGWDMIDLEKLVFKPLGIKFDFSLLTRDYLTWYGCPDTDLLRLLWKILRPKLNPLQESAYLTNVRYTKHLGTRSSYVGVGVDVDRLKKTKYDQLQKQEELLQMLYHVTKRKKEDVDFNSPAKVADYLYCSLKVPTEKVRFNVKKQQYAADKQSLQALTTYTLAEPATTFKKDIVFDPDEGSHGILKASDLNQMRYPECAIYLARSGLRKNVTAYCNGILNNLIGKRYHPHIISSKTDTYRDTERSQITKGCIKGTIGTPNPETHDYTADDYMAEEFRLASYLSKDNLLSKALADSEMDPHTKVTSELYGIPEYAVDGKLRKKIKKCNFGIIYGMQETTLAKNLNEVLIPTEDMIKEAKELFDIYTEGRADLLAGLEVSRAAVEKQGYVYNAMGYRMAYPQVLDVDDMVRQTFDATLQGPMEPKLDPKKIRNMRRLMTVAGNAPIQSLAAGILKEKYSMLADELDEKGYDYSVVSIPITVHDEIGSAFNREEIYWAELMEMIKRNFETDLPFLKSEVDIRLFIGVGFGMYWGDAKNDIAEIPPKLQAKLIQDWKDGKLLPASEIGQGLVDYTIDLKKDWFKDRLCKVIENTIEDNTIVRHKVIYTLNHELYVAKNSAEVLDFKTDPNNPINNANIYISKYLEYKGLSEDDFTIIDGVEIKEEKEETSMDNIISFYQLNKQNIIDGAFIAMPHSRIVGYSKTKLEFNTAGLNAFIINKLRDYFKSIESDIDTVKNKQLYFYNGSLTGYEDTGIKLYGLPATFRDDIDNILNGQTVKFNKLTHKVDAIVEEPLYEIKDDKFIINSKTFYKLSQPFQQAVLQILGLYFKPQEQVVNPIIWLCYNTSQGLIYADGYLAAPFVSMQLQDSLNDLQKKFGSIVLK